MPAACTQCLREQVRGSGLRFLLRIWSWGFTYGLRVQSLEILGLVGAQMVRLVWLPF